ncbi:MAG: hypothetical protein LHW62_08465, partial [Candidatus Cloacimonetes bacterium]|nr:hypothetical protein [Candidatus Cloacimonadota bacterium]
MAKIQFPLQFERQYSNPIDIDMVFETTSILNSYLTDDKRYAGMIVTCKEQEGKIFVLNNDKDEWLTFDSSLYEKTANKVTSFNTPTDTEYPSAKLVKDYVDSKVSSVYKIKGSVADYASLPNENLTEGDVYNLLDTGDNYVWDGTAWDKLGGTFDLTPYELLSNKVTSWSSPTDNTKYPSEKLVKDSLDAINVGLENIGSLSPLRFAGYFTGGTVVNDFNNLIRPFENLTEALPDFYINNIKGAMFVCNAASDFVFNTVYTWVDGVKTTPITFNWAAPYDEGLGTVNFEVGDTISILNFAYDTVENKMFILVKVEKSSGVKADKVIPASTGNIPKLNASGNLEDSGFKLEKSVPSNAVFTDT